MATIIHRRSSSATVGGAGIGIVLGWLSLGPVGAIMGFVVVGGCGFLLSFVATDPSCSDCGGKLPTIKVSVCQHCRAPFTSNK